MTQGSLSEEALRQIRLFRRQYLQLLDAQNLAWPSSETLRSSQAQEWIYEHLFQADDVSRFLPPERYRLLILKPLMSKIENSIVDPEEDEISDNLMSTLAELMFSPMPDDATAAQQRNWVTYTPLSKDSPSLDKEPELKLLENRAVISGAGTTGLRTWEAALHLSSYLISTPELIASIKGKRVIELGAGTGLLSILCASHLGASQVVATDGDEGVVQALHENAAFNDVKDAMDIGVLWWGRALKGSWMFEKDPSFSCDLVLGADVTYDKAVIPALVSTMRDMFEVWPHVQIIISATIRNSDTFAAFEYACAHNEFNVHEVDYPLIPMEQQTSLFHSTAVPIKIFSITAPAKQRDPYAI
ncbi:hypothetical protein D6C91_06128 [Aureobasidium pullulans]|uniref:S-adenosyl-L-methionine-dependent methyltransferase n=1 Tax=Aureobasidium pullulans TaxID=5580 RepID=A0A4S9SZ30_AURPU|nr:hypothetical protein D6C91_06128 [Aureobasidium pullulans]